MVLCNAVEIKNRADRICMQTAADVCQYFGLPGNWSRVSSRSCSVCFRHPTSLPSIAFDRNAEKHYGFIRVWLAKFKKLNVFRYFWHPRGSPFGIQLHIQRTLWHGPRGPNKQSCFSAFLFAFISLQTYSKQARRGWTASRPNCHYNCLGRAVKHFFWISGSVVLSFTRAQFWSCSWNNCLSPLPFDAPRGRQIFQFEFLDSRYYPRRVPNWSRSGMLGNSLDQVWPEVHHRSVAALAQSG